MGITPLLRRPGAPRTARRALSFCAAAVMVAVLAACSDDGLLSPATINNETRVFSVWAITGTNSALPASYQFTTESRERPQMLANGSLNFDVAFDITADGKVAFHPVRALVPAPPAGAPVVGLGRSGSGFLALTRAPTGGYANDTTVVVGANEVVTIRLASSGCILGEPFYAKAVVDSIILTERRIVLRTMVNRNCGYRALTEGLPKN